MSVDAIIAQLEIMGDPATKDQKAALNELIDELGPKLNLNGKNLSLKDIQNLCETLKTNTQLELLALGHLEGWSPRNDKPFNREASAAIADLLAHNSSLRSLSLARNRLSDLGAHKICNAIQKNATSALETLNLTSNEIPISPYFFSSLEHTKLKKIFFLANGLSNSNSLNGIKSLLWWAPETLEEVDLDLSTNLELSPQVIATAIAEKVIRPVRPVTFFGKKTAEYPEIEAAFLEHAQFMKEMEEHAKALGESATEFLPDNIARIVHDYTGLPKASFEAALKEAALKKAESLPKAVVAEPKPEIQAPEATSDPILPPAPIQPIPPAPIQPIVEESEPLAEPVPPIMPLQPAQKTAEPMPLKNIIRTSVLVIGIAALITLSAFISPILAGVLGAITFVSVVGVVGYNALQNRNAKAAVQPVISKPEDTLSPPAVLPKLDLSPNLTPSQTSVQENATESAPKSTGTKLKGRN